MLYWFLKFVGLGPWLKLVWRPYAEGLENLPEHGGAILASNHLSFCDSFFMPLLVRRRVTFLAKAEYFTTGGMRILRAGDLLGIYPEGTRSPDGRLYRGKTGVARMALEAGVPVIPVAMIDTEKTMPTGRKIPHLRPRPGVRFGKPLDFSRYEGLAGDRFVERSMTDEIMYELMQLSGQEYVDTYAAKVKVQTGADLGFGAKRGIRHADAVGSTRDDRVPTEQAS